ILPVVPEFNAYESHDYWPLDYTAHRVLRTTTNSYQHRIREKNKREEAAEAAAAAALEQTGVVQTSAPAEVEQAVTQAEVEQAPSEPFVANEPVVHGGNEAPATQPQAEPTEFSEAPNAPNAAPTVPAAPEAPIAPVSPRPPASSGTLSPSGAPVVSHSPDDDIMDITKSFRDMAFDPTQDKEMEEPFTLPSDLTGGSPTRALRARGPVTSSPIRIRRRAANPPAPINITSTVTSTTGSHSVSNATSTVTTTGNPTFPVAPQTPARAPAKIPVSPTILRGLELMKEGKLSPTQLAHLPQRLQDILVALQTLGVSNIPMDAGAIEALLAASPTKNDPPPYESDPDENGKSSPLSEASADEAHGEDGMDIDDVEVGKDSGTAAGSGRGNGGRRKRAGKKNTPAVAASASNQQGTGVAGGSGRKTRSQGSLVEDVSENNEPARRSTRAVTQRASGNIKSSSAQSKPKAAQTKPAKKQ
ncbi:hypothetical protein FRC07_011943, partial [Ceratobasidium sp. 392]